MANGDSGTRKVSGPGLAAKITLPFVILFALLLIALGWILVREIFSDVEARAENEQRFVLEVAAFPGWPLGEESLRQIRDRAAGAAASGASEFIVLQSGSNPLTSLLQSEPHGKTLFDAFRAQLAAQPALEPRGEEISRTRVSLAGQDYMLLTTARATRGAASAPRRFFLLHPYSEIEQAKTRALWRIIALGVAGLALSAALGLALANWIARPVRTLAAAAQRVTRGGLNQPLDPILSGVHAGKDQTGEIGELTSAFRSMLDSLRQSQAEVLKAERLAATGKLAASVAHEIRNPLTSLRMTVQMLQSAPQAPSAAPGLDTQEAYRVILNEIDRLSLAVEELLTFARPRPPQKSPTDLNALAADTLKFLERQLAHAKVSARLEADAALPGDLQLDPTKMRQLLVNLVLNAQQAIVRGGEIVVRTRWSETPRRVTLEVQDSGPGVSPDVREKIFELFVSTKTGGGGLGLAIAKQIAEEHNGSISYESAPGKTIFRVELPA